MSAKDKLRIAQFWVNSHIRLKKWPSFRELGRIFHQYDAPHRHYHTLHHIAECLRFLDYRFEKHHHDIVMALIYHDIVYEIGEQTNKQRTKRI